MDIQQLALINSEATIFSTNLLVVFGIAAYSVLLARMVPQKAHLPLNIFISFITIGIGLVLGLNLADMGLAYLYKGLLVGGAVSLLIITGTLLISFIPAIKKIFVGEKHGKLQKSKLLFEATIRIPLGTALVEETLFRGLLFGLLLISYSTTTALVVSSLVFGLWHILPTIDSLAKNSAVLDVLGPRKRWHVAGVVGVVLITAIAGLAFSWLRLISGSLIAPWLVHWAINSSGTIASAFHGGKLEKN